MFYIQNRDWNGKWKLNSFARVFPTADEAWKCAASLDQDGFINPDVRVIGQDKKAVARPEHPGMYQAELLGL